MPFPLSRRLLATAAVLLALVVGACSTAPPGLQTAPPSPGLARKVASLASRTGARMGLVFRHVESGRSLEWNAGETFEGASVIKLALLAEAAAQIRDDELDPADRWKLFSRKVAGGSGVLDEFDAGLMPTNRDLLRLMLVLSDNTAANRFIDLFGAARVNARMEALGLGGIRLLGRIPDRDPEETEAARWQGLRLGDMTPRDTAEMLHRIATGTFLDERTSRFTRRLLADPRTRDRLPRLLLEKEGVEWAGKTGTMSGVRNDAGILRTKKGQFVLVAFAERIPSGNTLLVNRTMGEIASLVVESWSRDLPDAPEPPPPPARTLAPALPRVELTPLEARPEGPFMERVFRDQDRLFWELYAAAGGSLSDACLLPMPNSWWDGDDPRKIRPVTSLILHHTADETDEECISFFLKPESLVSSHFLVGRDGRLYQFVSLEHRSWHAGESLLHGSASLNKSSIGVEITGDGNRLPYTREQIETVVRLVGVLTAQFDLQAPWIAGHQHIAPVRKPDPGAFFPWNEVIRRGLEVAERLVPLVALRRDG